MVLLSGFSMLLVVFNLISPLVIVKHFYEHYEYLTACTKV